ncbi:hypothetical protein FOXYS1_5005 [Fusarium oxysporum]|uniref:Alpha/beta hydrolase fold-3 domain-containing protein n=1 Tax=Fusarium oxysporum TaxID=5507 RepID=A0A8H5AGD3_FUSOX|nr:hypothetical protein FOXYS1_5005 [Fusarium oxysporum]
MAERKAYIFKEVANTKIAADVYYGKEGINDTHPIALYVHGGSFTLGAKEMLNKNYSNKLTELGFVVVSPNYRLAPTINVFDGPVTDVRDAYTWAASKLPALLEKDANVHVDPKRVVVFGHSCGGTLALLTALLPNPPLAILDLFGMIYLQNEAFHTASTKPAPPLEDDFVNKVYKDIPPPTAGPSPFGPNGPNFADYRVAWMFKRINQGKHMSEVIADGDYARVDPATLFAKGFPPTYFIHGTADFLVPHSISQRAHDELKNLGVETQIELIEGAGHGFDAGAAPGDEKFTIISRGFDFLKAHV